MSDPIPTDDHPHARRREIEARVRRHLPLVFRTALRHWERLGRRVDYAELVEEGALAILRAAERHDERRASFRAHARRRLLWAMKDVARRRLGRREVHVGRHAVAARPREALPGHPAALGAEALEDEGELATSEDLTPEDAVARGEAGAMIHAAIDALDGPGRHVIERHYFDGERLCVIAGELGVSSFAVSRLHRRVLGQLRRALAPLHPAATP